jgi:hypothetical protein
MVTIVAIEGLPKLHVTPLASVVCAAPKIVVEADDEKESRVRFTFEPYQAIKMVTADCFDIPDGMSIIPQTIMEIENSTWVYELRNTLEMTDCEADFMDKARHFLLPLQDDFLEIVAWDVRVESVG